MTQEEIEKQTEEYVATILFSNKGFQVFHKDQIKLVFQDGAKWGMEHAVEWHDLRKNPNDLPEEGTEVLNDDGVKVVRINGHWRYVYGGEWEEDAYVDHWCELPKFER